ncbi:MAG: hypothetical protein EXX96DRAFT_496708 [Benjaminiella poitrasii]|nr:MAG: hypothetical protein EXX96DRAFT_496708 [Benjaminiella poitrasii]
MITMLQRLTQTDIRALNRQLRRAFDIFELSSMSNSIIENIITDVENLKTRFFWVEDRAIVKQELWLQDVSMVEFFPIMTVVQQMLREISELRMTLNDLQVEYVKKIEESDIRLEREVMRKQQISRQQRKDAPSVGPLAWLFSNVFQRSDSPPLSFLEKKPSDAIVPSYSPFHARFNKNDIISLSSSTPVLSKPKTIPSCSSRTAAVEPHKLAIQRHTTLDRQGPSSSYPTRSSSPAIGSNSHSASKWRSTHAIFSSTIHPKQQQQPSFPLRASQSAGTVSRRSHVQAPALEYVVRKKRSALGLNSSSFSTDYNQPSSGDMAGTFTTSWLGNK